MIMSKDEITSMYRGAANQFKQISILAEMNCCTKKEMREYLRQCGYEVYEPKGRQAKKETVVVQPEDDFPDIRPVVEDLPFVTVPQDNAVTKITNASDIKAKAYDEIVSAFYSGKCKDFIDGFIRGIDYVMEEMGIE